MAHDDQFTAKGPPFNGAGVPRAGFSTIKTDFDFVDGVNAQGEHCGVYGESSNLPFFENHPPRKSPRSGVGVCGMGMSLGVYGKGQEGGVYGESESRSYGVRGTGLNQHATGVEGNSKFKFEADLLDDQGNPVLLPKQESESGGSGVIGAAEGGRGFGVAGLSVSPGAGFPEARVVAVEPALVPNDDLIHATDNKTKIEATGSLGSGIGVLGMSGTGSGIFGQSESGAGVHGIGGTGPGGKFESGDRVAQLRLVPHRQQIDTPQLPKRGKIGDLVVIRNTFLRPANQDVPETLVDLCTLWLCIPRQGPDLDHKSGSSNLWQQVQLGGAPVLGTI